MLSPPPIADPVDLIVSVPAMLGFTPNRSLVLVFVKRETGCDRALSVPLAVRTASPLEQERLSDTEIAHLAARMCRQADASAVLAVLVDDRQPRPAIPVTTNDRYGSVLEALDTHLDSMGLKLGGAWSARFIATDAAWWNPFDPQQHGHLPNPARSPIAVRHKAIGRPIHRTRDELAAFVDIDVALRDRVTALLPNAAADAQQRLARTVRNGDPDAYTRQAVAQVMSTIKDFSARAVPSPQTLAYVAVALRDKDVRDVMFGVAGGVYADRAERLWTVLTRALPDPDRAEAATLLAFHALLRGEGVRAGIAVDAALAADPEHRMAYLLGIAAATATPPQRMRRLCRAGIEAAAELRIDIGAAEPDSHTKENLDDHNR
ncbi:DUF4192 domain-containing protein [Nocardia sp. SYP-A9097]|uniref:DUF4192 domain-containing protein n=1 Tax=Nocardia sp. SYP-A9097 TaxID=2663237 RepID=UPI0018913BD9|nr:DUF4192 domain-containing protein [Nocardia sp. SYP-A9097]